MMIDDDAAMIDDEFDDDHDGFLLTTLFIEVSAPSARFLRNA